MPSHLIPSRPQERRMKSSARRDWRSQASGILEALCLSRAGISVLRARHVVRNDEGLMNSAILLLVDAASQSRDSWKSFLQNQNYDVFTAEDGESALRECVHLQPDLVLLHDGLPDVGCFELCRRMKGNPLNQQIPIVLIKPSQDPEDAVRGREAGAADFWGTCCSLSEALSRVQSLLRLKTYIDEQAKSVVLSLARSIEAKSPLMNGHSDRIVDYAKQLGTSLDLPEGEFQVLQIPSFPPPAEKVPSPHKILLH